jgi:hypothetical protein
MQDWNMNRNLLHSPNHLSSALDCSEAKFFPKPFSRVLYEAHDSSIDWASIAVNSCPASRDNRGFSWFNGSIQPSVADDFKYMNTSSTCFGGRFYASSQVSDQQVSEDLCSTLIVLGTDGCVRSNDAKKSWSAKRI